MENGVQVEKRSVGITILSIYLALCAIPGFFGAVIAGISGFQARSSLEVILNIIMRILFISNPIVFLAAAIGLFKLKNWARLITIFFSPILSFIAIGMSGILLEVKMRKFLDVEMPSGIISLMIPLGTIAMSVGIIYYLTHPKIKEQFK